jgi:methylated-DNA-[protein]-cysteine S-methyltransferase
MQTKRAGRAVKEGAAWLKAGAEEGGVSESGFALFETPIGRCGIAWRLGGICGVQLPEANDRAAMARLRRRFPALAPAEPPAPVAAAIARISAFLAGGRDDFRDLPLDFTATGAWEQAVYEHARAIPAGTTITYGALAAQVGDPGQARAVGQALGRNPWPIVVPCHRITAAEGRMGGFSAPGGTMTKLKLLEIEGALAAENLPLFSPSRF